MARTEGIDAVMDKFHLDALVAPTGGPAWTTDLVNGDHGTGGSSDAAAVAGYPNINVPAGFVFGLARGHFLLRARLQRADAHQAGLRVRAGHESASPAAVFAHGRPESLGLLCVVWRGNAKHQGNHQQMLHKRWLCFRGMGSNHEGPLAMPPACPQFLNSGAPQSGRSSRRVGGTPQHRP